MRNSLDYAGLAQLCARSPIMRKIMRAHNRIIQPSLADIDLMVVSEYVQSITKHPRKRIISLPNDIDMAWTLVLVIGTMKFKTEVGD